MNQPSQRNKWFVLTFSYLSPSKTWSQGKENYPLAQWFTSILLQDVSIVGYGRRLKVVKQKAVFWNFHLEDMVCSMHKPTTLFSQSIQSFLGLSVITWYYTGISKAFGEIMFMNSLLATLSQVPLLRGILRWKFSIIFSFSYRIYAYQLLLSLDIWGRKGFLYIGPEPITPTLLIMTQK